MSVPLLERILYFPGELLTADDLTTADSNNRERRWLHNRTLHNWGIGVGLDVQGSRGATFVSVNPGYAIDIVGREIILSSPVQQPIPAVPGGPNGGSVSYFLVANYVDDAHQTAQEQRAATACAPGGAVRLSNDPAIRWKTINQLNFGIDVILCEVWIQNCVLNQGVSNAVRRYAATCSAFSLKAADVHVKDITWTSWRLGGINVGFVAPIDTSAANFRSTPKYTAHIVGSRSLASPALVVSDFVTIGEPSATGFILQVALPQTGSSTVNPAALTDPVGGPKIMTQLGWRVSWFGVEA